MLKPTPVHKFSAHLCLIIDRLSLKIKGAEIYSAGPMELTTTNSIAFAEVLKVEHHESFAKAEEFLLDCIKGSAFFSWIMPLLGNPIASAVKEALPIDVKSDDAVSRALNTPPTGYNPRKLKGSENV